MSSGNKREPVWNIKMTKMPRRAAANASGERLKQDIEDELARRAADGAMFEAAPASGVSFDREETGEEAVAAATSIADLKRAERPQGLRVKKVGERAFEYWAGFWIDRAYKESLATVEVKYLSDAYFKLLERDADLKEAFALGESVLVVLKSGKAVLIGQDGKEDLTDKELGELFK